MKIVLIGPQGCGKGTLAANLVKTLNIPTISLGDMFRVEAEKKSKLGLLAKSYMEKGELVPTMVSFEILKERLLEKDAENGFILDAYPRTLEQAILLDDFLQIDRVLLIDTPIDVIKKRIQTRRSCKKCGRVYSTTFYKQPNCECGGELFIRDDDKDPKIIEERLSIYYQNTQAIVSYYREKGVLREIDGGQTPEMVLKCALEAL